VTGHAEAGRKLPPAVAPPGYLTAN